MEAKRFLFVLCLAVTVSSFQVSGRRLVEDLGTSSSGQNQAAEGVVQSRSRQTAAYKNLDEIDRLKVSISELICDALDEGCDYMDDAADRSENHHESFANLNPHDHVRDD